jgi:hypothetical protein
VSEQPEPEPEPADDIPGLEDILRASQGIGPDFLAMAGQLASIHAEWRKAWENTGVFDHSESFELVRILVASSAGGIRFLG